MDQKKLTYFKKKLLEARTQILNSGILNDLEDIQISSDDLADEADLATNAINQQVTFSIRARELNKLRRIEAALQRVEDGVYGFCLESGEEIEVPKHLIAKEWPDYMEKENKLL